jgi:hypothetical protein
LLDSLFDRQPLIVKLSNGVPNAEIERWVLSMTVPVGSTEIVLPFTSVIVLETPEAPWVDPYRVPEESIMIPVVDGVLYASCPEGMNKSFDPSMVRSWAGFEASK